MPAVAISAAGELPRGAHDNEEEPGLAVDPKHGGGHGVVFGVVLADALGVVVGARALELPGEGLGVDGGCRGGGDEAVVGQHRGHAFAATAPLAGKLAPMSMLTRMGLSRSTLPRTTNRSSSVRRHEAAQPGALLDDPCHQHDRAVEGR